MAESVAESVAGSAPETDVNTVVDPVVEPVAKPKADPLALPFIMPFPTRHYYEDNNPYRAQMPTSLMSRHGKFNSSGKPAIINVNSHRILAYPKHTIYQYDVSTFSFFQLKSNFNMITDQHRDRSREAWSHQGGLGIQVGQGRDRTRVHL